MKLTIKVKRINKKLVLPEITSKGDWIDLRSSDTVSLEAPQAATLKRHKLEGMEVAHRDVRFDSTLIGLGVAMQLPDGFEAIVAPRSSTYKHFHIIEANHIGIIDNSYCGNNDEWKFPAIALKDTVIMEGERICQFRIQLSQKATVWQKLKWLLCSGVKIVEVESLDGDDRKGFGSTGVN
jgi:dUTP pyrophosphatase